MKNLQVNDFGNPPFLGGGRISGDFGSAYKDWLFESNPGDRGVKGRCDLCAFFFRRLNELLGAHGTLGFVATNTIAQGDTRSIGIQHLVGAGSQIYDAVNSTTWPGDAAVTISIVHLVKGEPTIHVGPVRLDGLPVQAINSRLRAMPERADPVQLADNKGLSFQGSIVLGMGFTLTPDERDALISQHAGNAERIFPYLGGQEVNTSPTQSCDRYVISFGQMSLEEADQWPDLARIVREKVKPERLALSNNPSYAQAKKKWWQHYTNRPGLYAAIAPLERCLVTALTSKHRVFRFVDTQQVLDQTLVVFPVGNYSFFAVLQSRCHEPWVWLQSATMRMAGSRYTATDCFETFPFPQADPRVGLAGLERVGGRLYETRAQFMVDTGQGLTKTYNALKDPTVNDARVEELRQLHVEMDHAVLAAYAEQTGDKTWLDIEVPAYTEPQTPAETSLHQTFEDQILDRLFALNEQRASR